MSWNALEAQLSALPGNVPIALLPVRLETRFFEVGITLLLRVRVYPDALHVDSLRRDLSTEETARGAKIFRLLDRNRDRAAALTAFAELCAAVGVWRASWALYMASGLAGASPSPVKGASIARLLPVRWGYELLVRGRAEDGGDERVRGEGGLIAADLPASVDLTAEPDGAEVRDLLKTAPWLVDFDVAVSKGMAFEVTIPAALRQRVRADGIDRLVVFGVMNSTPQEGAQRLDSLLESHAFTDGLGFLPVGAPTNRDPESDGVALKPTPESAFKAFEKMWQSRPAVRQTVATEGFAGLDNVAATRVAFGLRSPILHGADHGTANDREIASSTNQRLWDATWGRYLDEAFTASGHRLGAADREKVRVHFVENVTAFGPLPTLRIGRQPYGLLPVQARPPAAQGGDILDQLERFVWKLVPAWEEAARSVPMANPDADDSAQDDERVSADNLQRMLSLQPWPVTFAARTMTRVPVVQNILQVRTLAQGDLKLRDAFDEFSQATTFQKQLEAVRSASSNNRIWRDFRAQVEAYAARLGLLISSGALSAEDIPLIDEQPWAIAGRDPADDAVAWRFTITPTERLGGRATDDRRAYLSLVETLMENGSRPGAGTGINLPDLGGDLGSGRSEREAPFNSRFVAGTLALASNRLDAWVTAAATGSLRGLRASGSGNGTGTLVGAWGVVRGLKPASEERRGEAHLTPSFSQAVTTGVLRAGHAALDTERAGVLAIDLSSARVRLARAVFDAMRQGQRLGLVLGQMIERALHDDKADAVIYDVRQAVGLALDLAVPVAVMTDGLLVARAMAYLAAPASAAPLTRVEKAVLAKLEAVSGLTTGPLKKAANVAIDALDAISDASIFEASHQLLSGNLDRASAALEAVDRGGALPPDLVSLEHSRGGMVVDHRVLLALPIAIDESDPNGWRSDGSGPALLAPELELWAARLLGHAGDIALQVAWRDGERSLLGETYRLSDLGIAALDFCLLAPDDGRWAGSELETFILDELAPSAPVDLPGAVPTISDEYLRDHLALARTLRGAIASLRPMEDKDAEGVASGTSSPDLAELAERLDGLAALVDSVAIGEGRWRDVLRLALRPLRLPREPGDSEVRAASMATFAAEAGRVVERLRALAGDLRDLGGDPWERLRSVSSAVRETLGVAVPIAPRWGVPTSLLEGPVAIKEAAVCEWATQVAKVRPRVDGLLRAIREAEMTSGDLHSRWTVKQSPESAGSWVGNARPSVASHHRSWVVIRPETYGASGVWLHCDAWSETLPEPVSNGSALLRWNAPASRAPQSILLAVPREVPRGNPAWTAAGLAGVVSDALTLAAIRLVEATDVPGAEGLLPALIVTERNVTPGTLFTHFDINETLSPTVIGIL
ncbi:MAG: hypothetical protein Q8S73_30525 [Deltaproteobacteria bacterium]|nr:hypothetical protein [Myxococcales bacterium]MDP3218480.1 hypothetical protein [Deltaproteobacteria bacterium]